MARDFILSRIRLSAQESELEKMKLQTECSNSIVSDEHDDNELTLSTSPASVFEHDSIELGKTGSCAVADCASPKQFSLWSSPDVFSGTLHS